MFQLFIFQSMHNAPFIKFRSMTLYLNLYPAMQLVHTYALHNKLRINNVNAWNTDSNLQQITVINVFWGY